MLEDTTGGGGGGTDAAIDACSTGVTGGGTELDEASIGGGILKSGIGAMLGADVVVESVGFSGSYRADSCTGTGAGVTSCCLAVLAPDGGGGGGGGGTANPNIAGEGTVVSCPVLSLTIGGLLVFIIGEAVMIGDMLVTVIGVAVMIGGMLVTVIGVAVMIGGMLVTVIDAGVLFTGALVCPSPFGGMLLSMVLAAGSALSVAVSGCCIPSLSAGLSVSVMDEYFWAQSILFWVSEITLAVDGVMLGLSVAEPVPWGLARDEPSDFGKNVCIWVFLLMGPTMTWDRREAGFFSVSSFSEENTLSVLRPSPVDSFLLSYWSGPLLSCDLTVLGISSQAL